MNVGQTLVRLQQLVEAGRMSVSEALQHAAESGRIAGTYETIDRILTRMDKSDQRIVDVTEISNETKKP